MLRLRFLVLSLVLVCLAGIPALAEEKDPEPARTVQSEYRETLNKAQAIYLDLEAIKEAAIRESPELQKLRQDFQELVRNRLVGTDLLSAADLERIQEIQGTYHAHDTSEEEKQALDEEFRKLSSDFKLAQSQVMEDPEVQKVSRAYQEALLDTMQARDPETKDLVEAFNRLQARLQVMQAPGFFSAGGQDSESQRGAGVSN